jgi:hypothetical protein
LTPLEIMAVLGFSLLWSIHELFEQEERAQKDGSQRIRTGKKPRRKEKNRHEGRPLGL